MICLQNYVRNLLSRKLEESAMELERMGQQNKQAMEEAIMFRDKAEQLQDDYENTIQGHGAQMSDLEAKILQVKEQLDEAERQKQLHREEARMAKLKEQETAREL